MLQKMTFALILFIEKNELAVVPVEWKCVFGESAKLKQKNPTYYGIKIPGKWLEGI